MTDIINPIQPTAVYMSSFKVFGINHTPVSPKGMVMDWIAGPRANDTVAHDERMVTTFRRSFTKVVEETCERHKAKFAVNKKVL